MWSDDELSHRMSLLATGAPARELDPQALLRTHRFRERRRVAARSSLAALTLVAAGTAVHELVPTGDPVTLFGSEPTQTRSARDWFLTGPTDPNDPSPSPTPSSSVPRPTPDPAQLMADVQEAGLPAGTVFSFAEDGEVAVTLPDGRRLTVHRQQLGHPFAFRGNGGDGRNVDAFLEDVPGTADAAALYPRAPHADLTGWTVAVVTAEGELTQWWASTEVSLEDLRTWAFAAARR